MWEKLASMDDERTIYNGLLIKVLPTEIGISSGNWIPEDGLIYMLVYTPDSKLITVCLSHGEEANVYLVIDDIKVNQKAKVLKEKLLSPLQDVEFCCNYYINIKDISIN